VLDLLSCIDLSASIWNHNKKPTFLRIQENLVNGLINCLVASIITFGCKTSHHTAQTKSWDDVAYVEMGRGDNKIVECRDGRRQRVIKNEDDTYTIRERDQEPIIVTIGDLGKRICETGENPLTPSRVFELSPVLEAGGRYYLLPLYQLGRSSFIQINSKIAKLRINDAIGFDMSGNRVRFEKLFSSERYLEIGQTWSQIIGGQGKRFSAIAISAESVTQQGKLIVTVTHKRPIDFPKCPGGQRYEIGGGCYNSSACFLPGGGCYNSSACYAPSGGCYNSSVCWMPGGGCYNGSACWAPGGGCYNGSACWVPGGTCNSSRKCWDKAGRPVSPRAGFLVVDPSFFLYNNCKFNVE
jgi:hypothetical protein